MAKKTWLEKRDYNKSFKIKTANKRFADIPEGSTIFIPTPQIIDNYINQIPLGHLCDLTKMRNDLATEYQTDKTCPVTSGILLRIVSEASFEEFNLGKKINEITPFWRVVDPKSNLAKKLCCGIDFIEIQRKHEGI